ncbi:MAG: hypothetical protein SPF04_03485 [Bacilli bacterium]|nr:hypothetical protein [Bacilli bacterium]MDY5996275.1 hypothetical protein [Bacilli bacterium]
MSKKSGFILLMVFIVLILGIYIYPSIKNDNYQKRLISDIYKNTDIKDIEYLNKDNNYYVVKDRDKVIVLDLNYEEVYSIDKSKLKDNDLDLVYRRNNLYYEEKIRDGDNLTYNFYNIDNNELAYQVLLGGNDG